MQLRERFLSAARCGSLRTLATFSCDGLFLRARWAVKGITRRGDWGHRGSAREGLAHLLMATLRARTPPDSRRWRRYCPAIELVLTLGPAVRTPSRSSRLRP